jgi:hypothetical protein
MLWNRKPKEFPFEEVKAAYESDIKRCYGDATVTVALSRFSGFMGFNLGRSMVGDRADSDAEVVSSDHEMRGIVHEFSALERHIACKIRFADSSRDDGSIGWMNLCHISLSNRLTKKRESRPEEHGLLLEIVLYDAGAKYREALVSNLRDAALSGFRFMHVAVGSDKVSEENFSLAMSELRERGYGPTRQIRNLKLWPTLELQNAPKWAQMSPDSDAMNLYFSNALNS